MFEEICAKGKYTRATMPIQINYPHYYVVNGVIKDDDPKLVPGSTILEYDDRRGLEIDYRQSNWNGMSNLIISLLFYRRCRQPNTNCTYWVEMGSNSEVTEVES